MKRQALKLGAILLVLAAGGFLIAASGLIPIKASSGHGFITEWFLQFSLQRSTALHSLGIDVPPLNDPDLVLKGAGHYEIGCRSCHGSPGMRPPPIAQAMLPQPPELGPRIRQSNPKKLFHVVKHGLKFTGMPAWPSPHRDDEVWAMVAFLLKLPELDASGYRHLVEGAAVPADPVQPTATAALPSAVVQTCARCHGHDGLGRGSTVFPKLAGQRRAYLKNALEAYARGERHSGIMGPVAAGLSAETIEALADDYSRMKTPPPLNSYSAKEAEALELGRRIAENGISARRVPACLECHDPAGRRTHPAYPTLAGQPANYLALQLKLFQQGQRGGSAYAHLMHPVVKRLEAEEIQAVALYFESLASSARDER